MLDIKNYPKNAQNERHKRKLTEMKHEAARESSFNVEPDIRIKTHEE